MPRPEELGAVLAGLGGHGGLPQVGERNDELVAWRTFHRRLGIGAINSLGRAKDLKPHPDGPPHGVEAALPVGAWLELDVKHTGLWGIVSQAHRACA